MADLPAPLRRYKQWDRKFCLNGRRQRIGFDGDEALALLVALYDAARERRSGNWLLPFRSWIRHLQTLRVRAVLSYVAEQTDDKTVRILAIWLRGRLGGLVGTSTLATFCQDAHLQTRKVVARALVRLQAWAELREMLKQESDPRIRNIASSTPVRSYHQRLAAFASHAEHLETPAAKRRLFVAKDVDLRLGRPAKPIELIRAILERIHRLVMGH
jgi:hypothetical protein